LPSLHHHTLIRSDTIRTEFLLQLTELVTDQLYGLVNVSSTEN
jgi:hypothetical protein